MKVSLYGLLIGLVLCASCARLPEAQSEAQGASKTKPKAKQTSSEPQKPSPVQLKLVTLRDPVENAYTIGMPEGWANRTHSVRVFSLHSTLDITVSPNGSVLIFAGDPSIPQYWSPEAANPITYDMARVNPRMRIEAFRPAEVFFPEYVKRKFGKLPDFKITASGADEDLRKKLQARFEEAGVNMRATAAQVAFSYTESGVRRNALILGQCSDSGAFWIPTVSGITTTGNPKDYVVMIDAIGKTRKTNPEWQRLQNQKHQEAMAQIQRFGEMLTAQHNRNMDWIQQSAQRHQQRMQAIHATGDASMKAFNERMASSDAQHRNFLNYINDENTVSSASGKTYQVDSGYQRYFLHKRNGTYLGGDSQMDLDKLREFKLNPDDYEEVKIQKK
jgi:hypothetical protein